VGSYISYCANVVASGAALVLTATAIFLIVFLFSHERGIVWSRLRRNININGRPKK
jgi:ABC-type Mn2+/Zn2+ transport system permease subunit